MLAKLMREYFTFTRKERIAVLILVFLVFLIFLLPYLVPKKKRTVSTEELDKFKTAAATIQLANKNPRDSKPESGPGYFSGRPGSPEMQRTTDQAREQIKPELFYFDPNTLEINGWKKLGLEERNIRTIRNYLLKGGRFRYAEDIGKIYGLRTTDVERLKPLVRIKAAKSEYPGQNREDPKPSLDHWTDSRRARSKLQVDLNQTDTTSLIALPGIGSRLAERIIRFREKLGGFYSISQLSEVYGLPDSTFQKIRLQLTIGEVNLKTININTADVTVLKDHPYLHGTIANAVVAYRTQHGQFSSLDELLQIEVITPGLFEKLSPYLTIR